MAGDMKTFDSARRDLLRLSSMGLAASAVSALPALAKKAAAPALSPMLFDVRTFGATGDGKTVDSPAINKAIEAAAAAGGGTVIFPGGNYICFSIRLKSHVDLYLSQGCAIIAADSPKPGETTGYMGGTYDAAEPKTAWDAYQDYGHNHWHNSLLWGDGISDFSITGPGLIWGKGLSFGAGPGRPPAGSGASGAGFGPGRPDAPAAARRSWRVGHWIRGLDRSAAEQPADLALRVELARRVEPQQQAAEAERRIWRRGASRPRQLPPVPGRAGRRRQQGHRPEELPQRRPARLLHPQGRPLRHPGHRRRQPHHRQPEDRHRPRRHGHRLLQERARLQLHRQLAVGRRHRSQVQLCAGLQPLLREHRHHQLLRRRLLGAGQRAGRHLEAQGRSRRHRTHQVGTESNGGFINIAISNCVFEGCQGLALETVDGALLEDVAVTNITMRDIVSCPIYLRLGARLRGPKGAAGTDQSTVVGTLKRVLISNIACHNTASRFGSNITGIPGYPVEDLKISDVYVQCAGGGTADQAKIEVPERENAYPEPGMLGPLPTYGFYFRHVNRLEMSHVEVAPVAPDARPAIYLDDVHRADFFAITAPSSPPAFSINKSTDMRVLMSRAAPDSTTP